MIINEDTKAMAQAVVDYIESHPDKHEQASWFGKKFTGPDGEEDNMGFAYEQTVSPTACGTTMCVAGTALWLDAGMPDKIVIPTFPDELAAPLLGLNEEEAYALFFNMDESRALDMLRALANGDEHKFWSFAEEEE
jgi:hypothetical protein